MSNTRFTLAPGAVRTYEATDTASGVVLTFRECAYHTTKKIKRGTANITSTDDIARVTSSVDAIEQWLLREHPELITTNTQTVRARIGAKLKETRKQKKYTLMQLATLSGVDASNISRIEKGSTAVTIDTIAKLCDVLGLVIELA